MGIIQENYWINYSFVSEFPLLVYSWAYFFVFQLTSLRSPLNYFIWSSFLWYAYSGLTNNLLLEHLCLAYSLLKPETCIKNTLKIKKNTTNPCSQYLASMRDCLQSLKHCHISQFIWEFLAHNFWHSTKRVNI